MFMEIHLLPFDDDDNDDDEEYKTKRQNDMSFRYHDATTNYCKRDTESAPKTLK